jgi:hypothetical protein
MIDSAEFRKFLKSRFDLLPGHMKLLLKLADGECLCDAGKQMGLTESSVRTYGKQLLERMGVHCQHQAVALAYKLYLEYFVNKKIFISCADCRTPAACKTYRCGKIPQDTNKKN